MEKFKYRNLTLFKILLTMGLFLVFWDIGCIIGWNKVFSGIRNVYGVDCYSSLLKILFCVIFFILIKYYEKDLKFSLKEMFTRFDLKLFSVSFSVLFILELIMMFIIHKGWNFNVSNVPLIFGYLIVGFTEEFICRGYVFNALYSKIEYKKANIFQAIYFAVWHIVPYVPVWIKQRAINMEQLRYVFIWNIPSCIITGIIYGYIMKRTKSLWIPILLHASMDYLACLFYMN